MRCFLFLPALTSLATTVTAATINDFNLESNAVIPSEPSLPQQKKVRFVALCMSKILQSGCCWSAINFW